jgi:hypothetical protein
MSTPKKTRLASSVDDDENFISSISRSLKKRLTENDAATSLIQTEKDAAIANLELEFLELKRKLLEKAGPDLKCHLLVKKVPMDCEETKIKVFSFYYLIKILTFFYLFQEIFAPCGVILSCRMVVNFYFRTFIIIFNERESVTAAINNHLSFFLFYFFLFIHLYHLFPFQQEKSYKYNGRVLVLELREALVDPGFANRPVDSVTGHRS